VGLEPGPLSLVSITEELLGTNSIGFGLENQDYDSRGSAALTTQHPSFLETLALTSLTGGSRSVSIFRSRTKVTELVICIRHATCISLTPAGPYIVCIWLVDRMAIETAALST
jgi:hypothetical protein